VTRNVDGSPLGNALAVFGRREIGTPNGVDLIIAWQRDNRHRGWLLLPGKPGQGCRFDWWSLKGGIGDPAREISLGQDSTVVGLHPLGVLRPIDRNCMRVFVGGFYVVSVNLG
jgi:hypothetical protein